MISVLKKPSGAFCAEISLAGQNASEAEQVALCRRGARTYGEAALKTFDAGSFLNGNNGKIITVLY